MIGVINDWISLSIFQIMDITCLLQILSHSFSTIFIVGYLDSPIWASSKPYPRWKKKEENFVENFSPPFPLSRCNQIALINLHFSTFYHFLSSSILLDTMILLSVTNLHFFNLFFLNMFRFCWNFCPL